MDTLSALFVTVHTNTKVTRTNNKSRITKSMAQFMLAWQSELESYNMIMEDAEHRRLHIGEGTLFLPQHL